MRSRILSPVLIGLLSLMVACESKVTQANLDRIKPGMTIQEVERILGKGERADQSGMSISGAGVAGSSSGNSQQTYTWKSSSLEITVICAGGKVVQAYGK